MNKILIIFLICLISVVPIFAQDISRVGTSAAQFLKLGVGARAEALGGAAVTMATDVTALYWNPASIASINKTSLTVSRNDLYADLSYNFVGIVHPLGNSSALGISVIFLDTGNMEITTLSSPEGTGSEFNWESYCIGISYSRYVTDRLRLGGTVKYIREGAYHQKAQAFAIDLGSLLDTGVLGMKLGMCLSNFGGNMQLSGPSSGVSYDRWENNPGTLSSDAYLKTEAYPLPMTLRMGLSTQLIGHDGQITKSEINNLTLAVDAFDPNDSLMRSNLGLEYVWNNILAFRGGYHGFSVEDDFYDSYNTASYSFGGGLNYDFNFTHIQVDYAFTDFKILGSGHHFTLTLAF